jgi:CDP-paratose 2-epimerase
MMRNSRKMGTSGLPVRKEKPVLVTGGSGFIGSNLAHRLLREGREVVLLDSLVRPGVEANARWLEDDFGARVRLVIGDTRDAPLVRELVENASAVFHFAAQVAVTTSLADPRSDFEVNVLGTLNVLEAIRSLETRPPLVFTSTNKVYGSLLDVRLDEEDSRYSPVDPTLRSRGIDELRPLDFLSPYGCSKGAADQYVIDYARSFGLPATVFRMSCIYGPRQFGNEDQGWVAHFLIRAESDAPITLYGDGKQVRDILFVSDLVDALLKAERNIDDLAGRAFNIGGGPENVVSLHELIELIATISGRRPEVRHEPWRAGDQRYYVSDTGSFRRATGFRPVVGVSEGVLALHRWLCDAAAQQQHDPAALARRLTSAQQAAS